jgi:DNA-binding XRE family transcriptional regulator
MPRKAARQKRPRHVVFWVRETLELTQRQFGDAIGASWHTVQAIENQSLPLSHRFAVAISYKTGLSVSWLMRNQLEPLPAEPAKIRETYKKREDFGCESYQRAHLAPRDFLLKLYALERAVADELGPTACRDSGFYDILRATIPKLFHCIPNPRTRKRVSTEAGEFISGGLKKVLPSIVADIQELLDVIKKKEQKVQIDWDALREGLQRAVEWDAEVRARSKEPLTKAAQSLPEL